MKRLIAFFLLTGLLYFAAGCVSQKVVVPQSRVPLGVEPEPPFNRYRIAVSYTAQDDIGIPTEIREIRAAVLKGTSGGRDFIRWESYETRLFRPADEPPEWQPYDAAIGFEYLIPNVAMDPDYLQNLPNMASIPRDLDGFYFYINIIDLHMWDLYYNLFFKTPEVFPGFEQEPLVAIGDTIYVDVRELPIGLVEWENVSSDLMMTGGDIHAEYLGDGIVKGTKTKIVFFRQAQTINQNIYGAGMKMPYEGTNRFLGHMHLDERDQLVLGSYREFVYGKVHAPMSQLVIVHTERSYIIERIE